MIIVFGSEYLHAKYLVGKITYRKYNVTWLVLL